MKLTTMQREILEHRLDSGCVAEVLADTEELEITLEEAEAAAERIKEMVAANELPLESLSYPEMEVVIDCLDGCTYFAGADDAVALGEESRGRILAAHKAANQLEEAVSKEAGRRINCVRW